MPPLFLTLSDVSTDSAAASGSPHTYFHSTVQCIFMPWGFCWLEGSHIHGKECVGRGYGCRNEGIIALGRGGVADGENGVVCEKSGKRLWKGRV